MSHVGVLHSLSLLRRILVGSFGICRGIRGGRLGFKILARVFSRVYFASLRLLISPNFCSNSDRLASSSLTGFFELQLSFNVNLEFNSQFVFLHLTEKCRTKKKGPGPWLDSQKFHLHEKSGCLAMGPALFELQFISNSVLNTHTFLVF